MYFQPEDFMLKEPSNSELELLQKDLNDKVIYKANSFSNLKVVDNDLGRFLQFDTTYQAGIINTKEYKGNLPYINYFLLPALLDKEIKNILLIGLGSGKIANDIQKILPRIKNFDIVEMDDEVIKTAKEYFSFDDKNINIHLQDARIYLRENKIKYDLIISDIASEDGIALRVMTKEFFEEINNSLKKDGIFVSNFFSPYDFQNKNNNFLKTLINTYKQVFKYNTVFRCDYSDKIFYKLFTNAKKRVIDTTNAIFVSSNKINLKDKKEEILRNQNLLNSIGIKNTKDYIDDIFEDKIDTKGCKYFKD